MKKVKILISSVIIIIIFSLIFLVTATHSASKEIILATTTSTQDTGLLDILLPVFSKKTGYVVKTIAVGSGQAMTLGERGEADVLLVHSPDAEKKFVKDGYGINRRIVMHNDFILVGPPDDLAGIKGLKSVYEAFRKISYAGSHFISRGDDSGTHKKELKIWEGAGLKTDKEKWYVQTGLGMGQTLGVASEKEAYTLSDRGTYLAMKKNLSLVVLVEGDRQLLNVYHVIQVSPDKWPKVNSAGAAAFADFITSDEVQNIISLFGKDKYGESLFIPDAKVKEE
jgi:tungstate transport system substrate-binding protein